MTETPHSSPPPFDAEFREAFRDLVRWRRDVRRFRRDAVDPALIDSLLELASHAPSVGHCQPWRFVLVESAERRELIKSSFARANATPFYTQVLTDVKGHAVMTVQVDENSLADSSVLVQASFGGKTATRKFQLRSAG